jgi:hypothetical protein
MKKLKFLFCLLCFQTSLEAQRFPSFQSTNDLGASVAFLPATAGKPAVIFVQTNSSDDKVLQSWVDPLVQKFINKSGVLDALFESELYFLAFLNSAEALVLEKSRNKLQKELPDEMRGRCYYTLESSETLENVVLNGAGSYIVVVDALGTILGTVQGDYTEQKMELIEDLLSE